MKENPEVMKDMLKAFFEFRNKIPACRNTYCQPINIKDSEVLNLIPIDTIVD